MGKQRPPSATPWKGVHGVAKSRTQLSLTSMKDNPGGKRKLWDLKVNAASSHKIWKRLVLISRILILANPHTAIIVKHFLNT